MIRTAAALLGTAALVVTGTAGPASAAGGGDGASCTQEKWRKVAVARHDDESPYFREAEQADDDTTYRYFLRGERVVVRKRCGEFQLRYRTGDWRKLRTTNPVVSSPARAAVEYAADRCDQSWHRVLTRRHQQETPTFTPDAPAEGDEGLHYFAGPEKITVSKRCHDYRVRVRPAAWREYTTDDDVAS